MASKKIDFHQVNDEYLAERGVVTDLPALGARVEFRDDSPQYKANAGIVYTIEESPSGGNHICVARDGHPYVWLVENDLSKTPSRRRRRSGYVAALNVVSA